MKARTMSGGLFIPAGFRSSLHFDSFEGITKEIPHVL